MKTAQDVLDYLRIETKRLQSLGTYEEDADYLLDLSDIEDKMELAKCAI